MNTQADPVYEDRVNFGNIDSNVMFLEQTGVLERGMKILEIGSGRGVLLDRLRKQGYDVVGVEINKDYIEDSRILLGELPITLIEGTRLPFDDNRFDVVMSFDVLEHIPDSDAHLDEVCRVLKDKGFYLLQTPNQWTNFVFAMLIRRRLRGVDC